MQIECYDSDDNLVKTVYPGDQFDYGPLFERYHRVVLKYSIQDSNIITQAQVMGLIGQMAKDIIGANNIIEDRWYTLSLDVLFRGDAQYFSKPEVTPSDSSS